MPQQRSVIPSPASPAVKLVNSSYLRLWSPLESSPKPASLPSAGHFAASTGVGNDLTNPHPHRHITTTISALSLVGIMAS